MTPEDFRISQTERAVTIHLCLLPVATQRGAVHQKELK